MLAGGLAMLFGLIFRPLAQVVGWVAWVFLTYTIEMVRLTARAPLASVPVKMEGWTVWEYYALLAGLTRWARQTQERRRELWTRFNASVSIKAILGAAAVVAILGIFALRGLPDGKLHVNHGSYSSTTRAFLDTVAPELAVISVGTDNRFGHPCDEVLERLDSLPVYRTDEQGAIKIVSDGTHVWVETMGDGKMPSRSTASSSP
jgi:hypothetical protein